MIKLTVRIREVLPRKVLIEVDNWKGEYNLYLYKFKDDSK